VEDLPRAGEDPEVSLTTIAGIDNRMRRRFRGNKKMPKIGYGSDNATKFFLPNGLKKFVVHNAKDLDVLLMNNRTFCGEIAHNVSSRVSPPLLRKEPKSSSAPSRFASSSPTLAAKSEPRRRSRTPDVTLFKYKILRQYPAMEGRSITIYGMNSNVDAWLGCRRYARHKDKS
jgi:hypothetical protein